MEPVDATSRTERTRSGETDILAASTMVLLQDLQNQINLADTKAQLTLAVDAVLVGIFSSLGTGATAQSAQAIQPPPASVTILPTMVTLLSVLLFIVLLVSIYYALLAIRPAFRLPKRPDLYFFGSIAESSAAEFIDMFLSQQPEEAHAAVLAQIHAKARIAQQKFARLRHSLDLLVAALLLWGMIHLLLLFGR